MSRLVPRLLRVSGLLGCALILVLGVGANVAGAQTVYIPSSGSILLESTGFYEPVATSYLVPTSATYVVPTTRIYSYRSGLFGRRTTYIATSSYVPTSYVVPTTYYSPTRYVVRRPVYATSLYVPTTISMDLPVIRTTSSSCCGGESVVYESEPTTRVIRDVPISSDMDCVTSGERVITTPSTSEQEILSAPSQPAKNGSEPALNPGVLKSQPRSTAPPPSSATTPPPVDEVVIPPPADVMNPPPATPVEEPAPGTREVQRPAFRDTEVRLASRARGMLEGRVVSAVTGKGEANVGVTVADGMGRFRDRIATTDASGRFSVVLPEGDWTVQVPKGDQGDSKIEQIVTVAGGLITDEKNHEVTLLTINR